MIGEAEYSSYGKEAATKTRQRDIEAVGNRATGRNHLGTEQLVGIIIYQGKSRENLRNRVVELEKEIEKLKVSRDLETITLSKPPSGDILQKTENKQEEKPEENQTRKRKPGGQPEHRGKRRKVFGGVDRIDLR